MTEVAIHRLEPIDVPAILELWEAAELHATPKGRDSLDHITKEMGQGSALFLGAFIEGHMIGVALATHDGRKGWINRLAVRPEHRKKGIAQELVHACETAFKEMGLGLSCALVEDWNEPSMSLFEKEGYVQRKDIFYYRKKLTSTDW